MHTCTMKIILIIIYTAGNLYNVLFAKAQFEQLKAKPERCYGTDELMDRKCCIFPPFFNRLTARACGAIFSVILIDKEHNVSNLRRTTIKTCEYWRCILEKYNILDAEDKVNTEKYFAHLDKWMSLNPEFSTAMTTAKVYCREINRFLLPLTACEFFDFQNCIRNYVTVDCPKIVHTQKCYEWKEFYEECKEFFI